MSPPWMPLYIADYLADTGHLSAAEHGAYMLLIMRYWQDGGLPEDERLIARYAKLSAGEWAESRDIIAALFDDGWRHKRIDEELSKASDIIEKRKSSARKMHERRTCSANAEQVQSECSDVRVPHSHSPDRTEAVASVFPKSVDDWFEQFWKAYPRKVGKTEATNALAKARKRDKALTLAKLLSAIDDYKRFKPPDIDYCHPATWLNGGRWDDEWSTTPTRSTGGRSNGVSDTLAVLDGALERFGSMDEMFPDSGNAGSAPDYRRLPGH